MLTGSADSVVAEKNRHNTSIHHVSRADQNCAVLKRAENIMRHVEMWLAVGQKETVRVSRKMCSRTKDSVTKSCKFISRVEHHKQRIMFASPLGCGLPDQSLSGSGLITLACKNWMASAACVIDDTETRKTLVNLLQDCITKLCRDLCDAHLRSTELERTSACRFLC